MAFKNDMTLMYSMHDALRRELDRMAGVTARPNDDPAHVFRTALGWELFKSYLHIHHTTEDDMLWPPMRAVLSEDSDGAALLDAMEAEHATIDPLLAAIDAAVADPQTGPQHLDELTDALRAAVRHHLDHEEREGLVLIDVTVTEQQWLAYGIEHGKRLAGDMPRYIPWLLDGAATEAAATSLNRFPPPLQEAYHDQDWQRAYDKLTLWP